jgi:hypothetical protein
VTQVAGGACGSLQLRASGSEQATMQQEGHKRALQQTCDHPSSRGLAASAEEAAGGRNPPHQVAEHSAVDHGAAVLAAISAADRDTAGVLGASGSRVSAGTAAARQGRLEEGELQQGPLAQQGAEQRQLEQLVVQWALQHKLCSRQHADRWLGGRAAGGSSSARHGARGHPPPTSHGINSNNSNNNNNNSSSRKGYHLGVQGGIRKPSITKGPGKTPVTPTTRSMASGEVTRSWSEWGFCLCHHLCFGCYAQGQHKVEQCPGPSATGHPPGYTSDWVLKLPKDKAVKFKGFLAAAPAAVDRETSPRHPQGEVVRLSCIIIHVEQAPAAAAAAAAVAWS